MNTIQTTSEKEVEESRIKPFASHHQFLIIGGGSVGITVEAQLKKKLSDSDIAIIEPSGMHDCHPKWTLNAAGIFREEKSKRISSFRRTPDKNSCCHLSSGASQVIQISCGGIRGDENIGNE